jgi:hypothetical protein
MILDSFYTLEEEVRLRVGDGGDLLDWFFDAAYEYLRNDVPPKLPDIKVSGGRDFVLLLKQLDDRLRKMQLSFEWFPSHTPKCEDWVDSNPNHLSRQVKYAFSELSDTKVKGLFYFFVLAVVFYGGIIEQRPDSFVLDTFPFDVFDVLKPYVVSKKLEKEFSDEEVEMARKSVTEEFAAIERASLPPYATDSYIEHNGKFYLVYDVLKGIKR